LGLLAFLKQQNIHKNSFIKPPEEYKKDFKGALEKLLEAPMLLQNSYLTPGQGGFKIPLKMPKIFQAVNQTC
jgi:catalase (peroxidase I)